MPARKSTIRKLIRWLNTYLDPTGGTEPRAAFEHIFAMDVRPDVIFFLTDGQIQSFTAGELESLNDSGRKVVINTIAFGDPASQNLLKEIAKDSGGVYKFVPTGDFK